MSSIILTALIFAVFGLGAGIVLWTVFNPRPEPKNATGRASFRLQYVILPLAIFLLSAAITAWFYPRLPAELAYNFRLDTATDQFFRREMAAALMFLPQLILALPVAAIVWGITRLDLTPDQGGNHRITLERTMLIIGNMVALPQIIICFALTDIFSYNAYGAHLMPLWIFGVIILGAGTVFLGILFVRAFRHR